MNFVLWGSYVKTQVRYSGMERTSCKTVTVPYVGLQFEVAPLTNGSPSNDLLPISEDFSAWAVAPSSDPHARTTIEGIFLGESAKTAVVADNVHKSAEVLIECVMIRRWLIVLQGLPIGNLTSQWFGQFENLCFHAAPHYPLLLCKFCSGRRREFHGLG